MSNSASYRNSFDFRPMGKAIKSAREDLGWTQENTAEMLGISSDHIAAIENKGKNPGFYLFIAIQRLFGRTFEEFIFSASERTPDIILEYYRDLDYRLWVIEFFTDICLR